MGSHPTLDPAPTRRPASDRQLPDSGDELLEHLQSPAAIGGMSSAASQSSRSSTASVATSPPCTTSTTPT